MHSDQYLNLLMNEAGQQDPVVGDTVGLKTIILFFSFVVFFQQSLKRGKTEREKKKSRHSEIGIFSNLQHHQRQDGRCRIECH